MPINSTTTCLCLSSTLPLTPFGFAEYGAIPAPDWECYTFMRTLSDIEQTRSVTKNVDMCSGVKDTSVGSVEYSNMTVELAFDPADLAQIMASGHFDAGTILSGRETDSAGKVFYYELIVIKEARTRVDGAEVKKTFEFGVNKYVHA